MAIRHVSGEVGVFLCCTKWSFFQFMEAAGGAEETLQQSAWCAWSATLYAEQCKVSVSGYIVVVGQCMKIY